jgi:hypothetical protein
VGNGHTVQLLSVEIAKAKQEAKSLHSRLAELETTYGISSAEFMRRFQTGEEVDVVRTQDFGDKSYLCLTHTCAPVRGLRPA